MRTDFTWYNIMPKVLTNLIHFQKFIKLVHSIIKSSCFYFSLYEMKHYQLHFYPEDPSLGENCLTGIAKNKKLTDSSTRSTLKRRPSPLELLHVRTFDLLVTRARMVHLLRKLKTLFSHREVSAASFLSFFLQAACLDSKNSMLVGSCNTVYQRTDDTYTTIKWL